MTMATREFEAAEVVSRAATEPQQITQRLGTPGPRVPVAVERYALDVELAAALTKLRGAVSGTNTSQIRKEQPLRRQVLE